MSAAPTAAIKLDKEVEVSTIVTSGPKAESGQKGMIKF